MPLTRGGSPVREIRSPGSVRGAARKGRPYRNGGLGSKRSGSRGADEVTFCDGWGSHPGIDGDGESSPPWAERRDTTVAARIESSGGAEARVAGRRMTH